CPFPPPVHAAILTYSLHDALPIYACDHSHSYSAGPGPTPPIGKRHSLASIPPVSATAQSMDAPRCPAIIFCAPTVVRRRCGAGRSEEHTSELQSRFDLVCRLLLEK